MRNWSFVLAGWGLVFGLLAGCQIEESSDDGRGEADEAGRFISADLYDPIWQNTLEVVIEPDSFEKEGIFQVSEGYLYHLSALQGLQIIDLSNPSQPQVIGRIPLVGKPVALHIVDGRVYVLLADRYSYLSSDSGVDVAFNLESLILVADVSEPTAPRIIDQVKLAGTLYEGLLLEQNGQEVICGVNHSTEGLETTSLHRFSLTDGVLHERDRLDMDGSAAGIQAAAGVVLVTHNLSWNESKVALVSLHEEPGTLIEGATVQPAGAIQHKTAMLVQDGILQIASAQETSNHLQTWDINDVHNPEPIDNARFGQNADLVEVMLFGDKAFARSRERLKSVLHAFEISEDGAITQKAERRTTSPYNALRPVLGGQRLVGVGTGHLEGLPMQMSLYDATDLESPALRLASQESTIGSSFSDIVGFPFLVFEDTTDVPAADGTIETNLALLPFGSDTFFQLFTFSDDTLTVRGELNLSIGGQNLLINDDTVAHLSSRGMSLSDISSLDAPNILAEVELAPSYINFMGLNQDYGIRFRNDPVLDITFLGYGNSEIVPLAENPNAATPVAAFNVPTRSTLYKIGDRLVSIQLDKYGSSHLSGESIYVFDLSDPANPNRQILNTHSRHIQKILPIGEDLLVLVELGWKTECSEPLLVEHCPEFREWYHYTVTPLDLRNPDAPRLMDPIHLPTHEESAGVFADGERLYLSHKIPVKLPDNPQDHARYFYRAIDFSDVTQPQIGAAINIPGRLVAVNGDLLYSEDFQWDGNATVHSLNRLRLVGEEAVWEGSHHFPNQNISQIIFDNQGQALVSHKASSAAQTLSPTLTILDIEQSDLPPKATIAMPEGAGNAHPGEFAYIGSEKLVFTFAGGAMVLDISNPQAPRFQDYVHTRGDAYPSINSHDGKLYLAAKRYGIHTLDLD